MTDIRIRPYRIEDATSVWQAVRDSMAALQPWAPWCHPAYSIDESRTWLRTQVTAFEQRTAFQFAITTDAGDFLGGCGLDQLDALNQRANLGYWVRSSAAGRGVATAAVRLLRDWGFAHTDLARLEVLIAVENAASLRVAEKAGAHFEGRLRDRLVVHGTRHDAAMYSFTRSG